MTNEEKPAIRDFLTAEYWAKGISEQEWTSTTPIENFQFSMLKARILQATSQNIIKLWDNLCKKMGMTSLLEWAVTGLASYYVYTEQALVVTVSASEIYFKDRLAYTIQNDSRILKRFLEKEIKVKRIVETGLDLSKEIGNLIVENINFQDLDEIRKIYEKVYGFEPFTKEELKSLEIIFAVRHLIVHRAGIVDHKFVSETEADYKIGQRIYFERAQILQMIEFVNETITKIDAKIEAKYNKKKEGGA